MTFARYKIPRKRPCIYLKPILPYITIRILAFKENYSSKEKVEGGKSISPITWYMCVNSLSSPVLSEGETT